MYLPMGITTPRTATVRFSPRRKCSLPAIEKRERKETKRERRRERKTERECQRRKERGELKVSEREGK